MECWNVGKRTLLRIDGIDAFRYLNGQITQDTTLVIRHRDRAFATCVTDAKGRMQGYGSIFSLDGKSIYLEAPIELREKMLARIERYLIADDAEMIDVSDEYQLTHHFVKDDVSANDGPMSFKFDRLGVPGVDHWLPVDVSITRDELTWAHAENTRISHGIPRWGAELEEGILPPEAGLEASAISYTKGCYIGQEVISRMKTAGKVNRCLARLLIENDGCPSKTLEGEELLCGEVVVGQIRSHSGAHAIAWIKKNAFDATSFTVSSGLKLVRLS